LVTELTKQVVKKIFPAGSEIIKNPLDVPPKDRFWLIPGRNGPRWLIPQEKKYGIHVFRHWNPYEISSQVKWKILHAAYYWGYIGSMPGIQAVGVLKNSTNGWSQIGWNREFQPAPLIYFGTPCKTRKAVALLLDPITLKPCQVVKAPLSESSANNILREYDNLCYLEKRQLKIAPEPLFFNKETGISVQNAIIGSTLCRKFSPVHWKFIELLSSSKNTTSLFEHTQRLLCKISVADKIKLKTMNLLEKILVECSDSTSIPQVFVHGDFAPWNIKKANGSIVAFDWEFGSSNGLPLYDFFYFFLQQSLLFGKEVNKNRIFKILPTKTKKYPLTQILKFTAVSLGLRLAGEDQNTDFLDNFLQNIKLKL
jgi:hypothetical protein